MNSRVRIVKRGRDASPQSVPLGQNAKTERQSEREIVGAVKSWIAEWEERQRAVRQTAFAPIK